MFIEIYQNITKNNNNYYQNNSKEIQNEGENELLFKLQLNSVNIIEILKLISKYLINFKSIL